MAAGSNEEEVIHLNNFQCHQGEERMPVPISESYEEEGISVVVTPDTEHHADDNLDNVTLTEKHESQTCQRTIFKPSAHCHGLNRLGEERPGNSSVEQPSSKEAKLENR